MDAPCGGCDTARMLVRHATSLVTVSLDVPAHALDAYEAALSRVCETVGLFVDEARGLWRLEGVLDEGADEGPLRLGLLVAEASTGVGAIVHRSTVAAEGWLARTASAFPEQLVGRRFALRGTHLPPGGRAGRLTLWIDAGVAFGSGEHGSTRGCLRALERVAYRRPRRVLDVGCGSGVLAMAAARLLGGGGGGGVLASDIDPWAVRTARANVRHNGLGRRVRCVRADGWRSRAIGAAAPFDLVFANILARPLCAMAGDLAARLAPGGTAIVAGLLAGQARMVLAAHRRQGLVLERMLMEAGWATLVLRRAHGRA